MPDQGNVGQIEGHGAINEYWRAECEKATLILNHRKMERFTYAPPRDWDARFKQEGQGEVIPLLERSKWGHLRLIEQFVHWLDSGEPMETNVEDNLQSVALFFAGIESSRTGQPVHVQELLAKAQESQAM